MEQYRECSGCSALGTRSNPPPFNHRNSSVLRFGSLMAEITSETSRRTSDPLAKVGFPSKDEHNHEPRRSQAGMPAPHTRISDPVLKLQHTRCGFIGRHLVDYLVTNDLAETIRVVDKTPPQMAWLNQRHTAAFASPKVEFCSANLINLASCQNAFKTGDGPGWDYVINCAAETKPGQTDPVYQEGIVKLTLNCANEAVKHRVKRFVELSTGAMSSSEKVPQAEDCPMKPWTMVGKYKAQTEQELANVEGLNYLILRLPICYGIGDRKGLTPRLIISGIYKYIGETMKLLWTGSMKMNVVHVEDVCCALWELMQNEKTIGETINVCDDSEATQESISDILADLFGIKTDYWGVVMSSMTKADMAGAIEEINDKHLGPWAEVCQKDGVLNTPLTPYMDQELLLHKHLNLDNSKLKSYGYQLRRPRITRESLEEIVRDFVEMNHFPVSLLDA